MTVTLGNACHQEKAHDRHPQLQSAAGDFRHCPTLDPLIHITERGESLEDRHWIDLTQLDVPRFAPGCFASDHAYPYDPDFMSEDPHYVQAQDAEGPNSDLGSLTPLRNYHHPLPLLMAEFGVPSSWGIAHVAHSGMPPGGHDEVAQGHYAVRLFQNSAPDDRARVDHAHGRWP